MTRQSFPAAPRLFDPCLVLANVTGAGGGPENLVVTLESKDGLHTPTTIGTRTPEMASYAAMTVAVAASRDGDATEDVPMQVSPVTTP